MMRSKKLLTERVARIEVGGAAVLSITTAAVGAACVGVDVVLARGLLVLRLRRVEGVSGIGPAVTRLGSHGSA